MFVSKVYYEIEVRIKFCVFLADQRRTRVGKAAAKCFMSLKFIGLEPLLTSIKGLISWQ